jgi:hypothetical protein
MLDREQSIESRSRLENLDEFMSVPKDYEENTPLEACLYSLIFVVLHLRFH